MQDKKIPTSTAKKNQITENDALLSLNHKKAAQKFDSTGAKIEVVYSFHN